MKKLNRYLLLHYPQIWNLRLLWVLPAIAILHLAFYAAGYNSFVMGKQLHDRYGLGEHVLGESVGFSMLVSALLIIVWLVFYLRNNPFKSFYPVSRWYFVIEFSFLVLIFAGSTTFYNSYARGYWQSIKNKTANINLIDEANTLNISFGLIPKDRANYRLHACCDSLEYIDSLRSVRRDMWDKIHKDDKAGMVVRPANYKEHQPVNDVRDTIFSDIDSTISYYEEREHDHDFNYLHFCFTYYNCRMNECGSVKGMLSSREISAKIRQMLTTHDKAAVSDVLTRFDKMCDKYEVYRNISPLSYIDKVFQYPDFHVDDFLIEISYDADNNQEYSSPGKRQLSFDDVSSSLSKIEQARSIHFDFGFNVFVLYMAFSLALLLYSYRLSARRPWFIAVIGIGVLGIVVGLCAISMHSAGFFYSMLLILMVAFYVMHLAFRSAVRRTLSGVNLVWLTWMLPLKGMIVLELIKLMLPDDPKTYMHSPFYYTIQNHYWQILFVYLIAAFIYTITLLSALYRRWQAMAEE